jgi:ribosomal-protein-alanine N-acetyltransferase
MSEAMPESQPSSALRSVDLTAGLWPEVVGKFIETMPFEDRQAFGAGPSLVMELASGRLGRFEGLYDPGRAALLGMVGGWVLDYEAEIHLLYIRSCDRRRGFGRKLLSSFLGNLDASGVRAAYLEVRESNRVARFLYYSLGFRLQGVRKNYYQNPTEDGLVMVREVLSGDVSSVNNPQQEV